MPIKPENRSRYPANWKQIREQILEREGNCCKKCRVPNYSMIRRGKYEDKPAFWINGESVARCEETGEVLGPVAWYPGRHEQPEVKIVLTVAHLDHVVENCDPDNLAALCQLHHLRHDHDYHKANAAETRRKRCPVGDLFV